MKVRGYDELPDEAADAHLQWVVETEIPFLADLAAWMQATDGPLAHADGSFHSLDVIGDWFIHFLDEGCPGVPRNARPAPFTDQDYLASDAVLSADDEAIAVALYAAQAIGRYHRPVFATLDPEAHWAVFRKKAPRGRTYLDHNEVGIEYTVEQREPKGQKPPYFAFPHRQVSARTGRYMQGEIQMAEYGRPQRSARFRAVPEATPIPGPTQRSILTPLLGVPGAGSVVHRGPLTRESWGKP